MVRAERSDIHKGQNDIQTELLEETKDYIATNHFFKMKLGDRLDGEFSWTGSYANLYIKVF